MEPDVKPDLPPDPSPEAEPAVSDLEVLRLEADRARAAYDADKASGDGERALASLLKWQRANAALQRGKKAAGVHTGPVVTAEELVRLEGHRQTIEWVIENMYAQVCPGTTSKLAKSLWEVAHADKPGFLKTYMPLLLRGEKQEESEGEDEAVKGNLQLIEEWFAQQAGVCPHCGRGGG